MRSDAPIPLLPRELELHFLQHVLDVHFYCAFGDIQAAGNHLVRQTLGNQLENIALAWG